MTEQRVDAGEVELAWQRYIPALLVLFAFVVRALYLFTMRNHPWVALPIVDEIDYDRLAKLINRFGFSETLPAFRPPLWPLLLSYVYKLFGEQFVLARLVSAALGALSVGSLYRLSIRLFSLKTSAYAAISASLMGVAIHLESSALATSLLLLLLFEAILAVLDWRHAPTIINSIRVGILFGLAILARPIAIFPALIVLLDTIIRLWNTDRQLRCYRPLITVLLLFLLVLTPLAIGNLLSGGNLIASNSGVNLYLGNRTGADGVAPVHPVYGPGWTLDQARAWAEQDAGQTLNDSQVSSWYVRHTLNDWLDQPGNAIKLTGEKLLLSFGGQDLSNNGDLGYFRQTRPFLFVTSIIGTWWIVPLGLLGAFAAWRRSSEIRLVLMMVLVILLATTAVFVTTRFRLPAVLLLTPFAIDFIQAGIGKSNRTNRRIRNVLLGLAALVLLNIPAGMVAPKSNKAYGLLLDGQLYARAGMNEEAISSFNKALDENAATPLANKSLGFLYLEEGMLEASEKAFKSGLKLNNNPDCYRGLALVERARENHMAAADYFNKAYEHQPWNDGLKRSQAEEVGAAGAILLEAGKLDSSWILLRYAEEIDSSNPFFAFGRACIQHLRGDTTDANRTMDSLRTVYPDYRAVRDWIEQGWRP